MGPGTAPPNWIVLVVVALVVAFRLGTAARVRRLRLETLWIVPAVVAAALAMGLATRPPRQAAGWALVAVALAAGAVVGRARARHLRVAIDPATHRLNQQASPVALLLVVLVIVARQGLRYEAAARGWDAGLVAAALLAFLLGLVGATRAALWRRGRALLAGVGGPPRGAGPPGG